MGLRTRLSSVFRRPSKTEPLFWGTALTGGGRYALFGCCVFAVSLLLSFIFFRQRELDVTVTLASVEFRDELAQSYDTESWLKPFRSVDIIVKGEGKLERLFVTVGDPVKKND